ncbi:IS5/IS1182 family transposase [Uliginosibacterium gangwonense]|uniref:IS5/IS1182 family transposase n=1 Tax=Uliginosibacterium gangwonense TaxID=392736 RepID=UPI000684C8B1|nr:IS5/IS1182 family transposase [Uliginosibacterium gangwonense]
MSKQEDLNLRSSDSLPKCGPLMLRASIMLWIDKDMSWTGERNGNRGHPRLFSDAAIQFCLIIKSLFGLALRQATSLIGNVLKLAGLNWQVPDYTTLSRRQRYMTITLSPKDIGGLLHLFIESNGIKILNDEEKKCHQHVTDRRRQWRKVHLRIDARTLNVYTVDIKNKKVKLH